MTRLTHILLSLAMLATAPVLGMAQTSPSRESAIKAAYLYNFCRYLEWPPSALGSDGAPFVVGIAGPSEVLELLANHVRQGKAINGRPIKVVPCNDLESFKNCHIVYLSSRLAPERRAEFVDTSAKKPVLLVSEGELTVVDQGGIHFVLQQNAIRVQLAANQVRTRGLKVSSKLLQVANVVDQR